MHAIVSLRVRLGNTDRWASVCIAPITHDEYSRCTAQLAAQAGYHNYECVLRTEPEHRTAWEELAGPIDLPDTIWEIFDDMRSRLALLSEHSKHTRVPQTHERTTLIVIGPYVVGGTSDMPHRLEIPKVVH